MKNLKFSLFIAFGIIFLPFRTFAFNPNSIITDAELLNPFALGLSEIQRILDRGPLSNYVTTDIEGVQKRASEIILDTAKRTGVSPKFLITLLQKEQSLIEDPTPSQSQFDWATGYGVCDGCTHGDDSIQRWKGLAKQLNSASLQFTEGYMADIAKKGKTVAGFGPGIAKMVDDTLVTPTNAATASLYTYTPHIHGNEMFYQIWNRYFTSDIGYPNGTLLQDSLTNEIYVVENHQKRLLVNTTVLITRFDPSRIIRVEPTVLATLESGRPVLHPNFSLLRDSSGLMFLLQDRTLRPIASVEQFTKLGFNEDEFIEVIPDDLHGYTQGDSLVADVDPIGKLIQNSKTGGVLFFQDGLGHAIHSKEILLNRFGTKPKTQMGAEAFSKIPLADPVKFTDGTLVKVKDNPVVYVISDGVRRAIVDEKTFLFFGYQWSRIIETNERSVFVHPEGEPLTSTSLSS